MLIDSIGLDVANSSVKIKTPLASDVYLNTVRELKPYEMDGIDNGYQIIYEYEGKMYLVGEPYGDSSSGRGHDRYRDPQFQLETILALAKHTREGQIFKLTIGLPAEDHKRKQCHDDLRSFLEGKTYTVKIQGKEKTFTIEKLHILLQPLGSLMYRIYDENGRTRPKLDVEKSMKILVIDVGYGTTDVVEVINMKPMKYHGIDIGMMTAINDLRDFIIRDYPEITGLPLGLELDALIRDNNAISVGGGSYNIVEQKFEAFQKTTVQLMHKIKSFGYVLADYDKVLFTGGSVTALAENLAPYTKGMNASRLAEGQKANAVGFYTYGVIK